MKNSQILRLNPLTPFEGEFLYTYIYSSVVFRYAQNGCLLRRRFLLLRNDNSQVRGKNARVASQWDSYLECKTPCIAPMGVEILFLLYFDFAQFDKAKKDYSGQRDESFYGILNICFKSFLTLYLLILYGFY